MFIQSIFFFPFALSDKNEEISLSLFPSALNRAKPFAWKTVCLRRQSSEAKNFAEGPERVRPLYFVKEIAIINAILQVLDLTIRAFTHFTQRK